MAEVSVNGSDPSGLDAASLSTALSSSSTVRRISQLKILDEKLDRNELHSDILHIIVRQLFKTYPYYQDRGSRRAVQRCLSNIIKYATQQDQRLLASLVGAVHKECLAPGRAASSAFVLVEWCSLLIFHLAGTASWGLHGLEILDGLSQVLEKCMQPETRKSVGHSAIIVTRRGFRKLFTASGDKLGEVISNALQHLCAKDNQPTSRRAVLLGVIAGVSARIAEARPVIESLKSQLITFFTREIIGSRISVAPHIASGLKDFFENFCTTDDFEKEVASPLERGLLRTPEILLKDVIVPLISSLPKTLDLSSSMKGKLLKPLLSNVKSSNPGIREGTVVASNAILQRCHDTSAMELVAEEILSPLKGGKLTVADHRIIHARILESIAISEGIAEKVAIALAAVASKEGNEAALAYETTALRASTLKLLGANVEIKAPVLDAFIKGISDTKPASRRIWLLRTGEILYSRLESTVTTDAATKFMENAVPKIQAVYDEVVSNPSGASQSGLAVGGYIGCVLESILGHAPESSSLKAVVAKLNIPKQCLVVEPKPSFLLSTRIYGKLPAEDDMRWFSRALFAVSEHLSETTAPSVQTAWAEAVAFLICSPDILPKARHEATQELTLVYTRNPALISSIVIKGLWELTCGFEEEEMDSASWVTGDGGENLVTVLRAICPNMKDEPRQRSIRGSDQLELQLCSLVVLARPELIPRVSWINLCLRAESDPGELAKKYSAQLIDEIVHKTSSASTNKTVRRAAYDAAAELAFVAPEHMTPLLMDLVKQDLAVNELQGIGSLELTIMKSPEGTPVVDVLAKKGQQSAVPNKNVKDYDILKWEEDLRKQLQEKKGQQKKLTPDEQAKVKAQLKREAEIRRSMLSLKARLLRGIGIIKSLATGPPTNHSLWLGTAVESLLQAIDAGACLVTGDAAPKAFIACAETMSSRLGPIRPFIGAATLRARNVTSGVKRYKHEALDQLVTRVLYRLRFAGEQRPFDAVSFIYMLPLVLHVLESGGFGDDEEERNTQLVLATEILSFHTDVCADESIPRQKNLTVLIDSMQKYTQHYKIIRDCFADICRCIAPNMTADEMSVLARGAIVRDVTVRTTVLQSISAEVDMSELGSLDEIWLAAHDDEEENRELGKEIWEESNFQLSEKMAFRMLLYLESKDAQLRRAAARSLADAARGFPAIVDELLDRLTSTYAELAKPRVQELDELGMPKKMNLSDPWEGRHGIGSTLKELAPGLTKPQLDLIFRFLIDMGPLSDQSARVRDEMVNFGLRAVEVHGKTVVHELMGTFEKTLETSDKSSKAADLVNEAVVVMYGALASYLKNGDPKIPTVIDQLLVTLSTPSEAVQSAIAECLPPLVRACDDRSSKYFSQVIDTLLTGKNYATQRGAAYGLAGLVVGRGIGVLKDYRVIATIKRAAENKKEVGQREAAFLALELLSTVAGRLFEPYAIQVVPELLAGFGDSNANVRDACLAAAKACFAKLSSFGVKHILPTLLDGLDDQQWRSKKGACDLLGAMAYLDPHQLAMSLPDIIPPLTGVLSDSHKEVRAAANKSLKRFGEVIKNPEIKGLVDILLKALSDPTKYTDDALDSLIKVQFMHYLDAPSLALVIRILQRGLTDRSNTKRKASQVIGSLAHLTERKDLISHLPVLVAGLRVATVDPVPTTRATASRTLGSLVEKLGEDALPDLIPSLMQTLNSETSAGDLLGSAQALSEVLAGLGTARLEETLPTILQNVESSKPTVREGFMSLFIFLPVCFGNSFANYLGRIIPPILAGLADEVDTIRETALRAGRLLVKNFANKAVDLLLPELERGLADDSYRIRLSSVELVGDLLFNLTGIKASTEQEEEEDEGEEDEGPGRAKTSLKEALGEEKRDKILSALYICRCDTAGAVRAAAVGVWKVLVPTPRILKELIPTLTQLLIRRLGSSNMEHKVIASNALGELIRRAGDGVLASLLPTLEEGLQASTDKDAKQGICLALKELISSASPEALEEHEKVLIQVVRMALTESDEEVREAAADAFDTLQQILGKRAVEQVLPYILNLLRTEEHADNALSALLTLLTEATRSNAILPNLIPTLISPPISAFNAKALASLSKVAGTAMNRRLPSIIHSLMDNIINCQEEGLQSELDDSFHIVILSIDEYDGLNAVMNVLLQLLKHADHRRRAAAAHHLSRFFGAAEVDYSRYNQDVVRSLLVLFDDGDTDVVKAALAALTMFTKNLKKEDMEALVVSTRQSLQLVGVPGASLSGFELPKGINAILPIFLQGLINGSADQRVQAALAISDVVDRTSENSLKPFVTQITGPLIRVVSERSTDVKAAILFTLNNLLEKMPAALKPFLPQLQRTFAKSLADPTSDVLRTRAAKALGTLIKYTPRVDPLITELVAGSRTVDLGVRTAMLKALYEVVSKAGANMGDPSRQAVLGLIDGEGADDGNSSMIETYARLLGALVKNVPEDAALGLLRNRVLMYNFTNSSALALNAVLVESPDVLLNGPLLTELPDLLAAGMQDKNLFIAQDFVMATGKYLLGPAPKPFDSTKKLMSVIAGIIAPGNPSDFRRLALVLVRTVSRLDTDLVRPHLSLLSPPVFDSVRDAVIPVKLAAEAAFVALFNIADEEGRIFDKWIGGPGGEVQPGTKKAMTDYFKRVGLRLGGLVRERREAEGGRGVLGLASDEVDDEREIWSVGKLDVGDGGLFSTSET